MSKKSKRCVATTNEVEVNMYSEGLADTMNSDLVCMRTVHTNNCVMGKKWGIHAYDNRCEGSGGCDECGVCV